MRVRITKPRYFRIEESTLHFIPKGATGMLESVVPGKPAGTRPIAAVRWDEAAHSVRDGEGWATAIMPIRDDAVPIEDLEYIPET